MELVGVRQDVAFVKDKFELSERRACELNHIDRSSYRYQAKPDRNADLRQQLTALAREKPRWGYRRLGVLLEKKGEKVNPKRLFRVYREAGLSVKRKKRKRLIRSGQPHFVPTEPNEQWALDFVHDGWKAGERSACQAWWTRTYGSAWRWKWTAAFLASGSRGCSIR